MVNRERFLRTIRMKKNGRQRFARLKIFQSDDRDMVILTDLVVILLIGESQCLHSLFLQVCLVDTGETLG